MENKIYSVREAKVGMLTFAYKVESERSLKEGMSVTATNVVATAEKFWQFIKNYDAKNNS